MPIQKESILYSINHLNAGFEVEAGAGTVILSHKAPIFSCLTSLISPRLFSFLFMGEKLISCV